MPSSGSWHLTYQSKQFANAYGSSVYVVKRYDKTAPTDHNVFSSTRARYEFLQKNVPDRAHKKIIFDEGLDLGDYIAKEESTEPILSQETAEILQKLMRNNVENYYGDENFEGLHVCAKSGTAELGGDLEPNAMFAGFVADEEYPLAFILVVENAGSGRKTCVPMLSKVLAACKEVLDRE